MVLYGGELTHDSLVASLKFIRRLDDIFMVIVLAIVILILSAMVVGIFRLD